MQQNNKIYIQQNNKIEQNIKNSRNKNNNLKSLYFQNAKKRTIFLCNETRIFQIHAQNYSFFYFTFLFISNNLNCSKENKKSISEETISKISYSIPTVAYFIRNLQGAIENIISAEEGECIKKESNKKIYDKCKLQDSLLMEGQIEIQPQISKYIINLKVSSISPLKSMQNFQGKYL
jgi:hypothetical protein